MSMKLIGSLSLVVWSLFMATSCWAQDFPPVLDLEGNPLVSGATYHVVPPAFDISSGLTLVGRNGSCPFYVSQVIETRGQPAPTVPAIPVTFTPRVATDGNIIRETRDFTAQFDGASTCVQSTSWRVGEQDPETGRRYVVVGPVPSSDSTLGYFNIVQNDGQYNIQWCPNCLTGVCPKPRCGSVDFVEEDGKRLMVLDGPAYSFAFIRVSN
ncbi:hypothetical protein Tsubulata_045284 [Turnera subulata]|uniref:Uncharacterized protein n=1 Tax=Turnera subulata TaxID=218843 RepID=A0A9Q0G7Z3_9ROSI|nr:hypothetical protein Tsubulata_045284 [Turnera subulata]